MLPDSPRKSSPWGRRPSGVIFAANTFPPCLPLDFIVCLFPPCLPLDSWFGSQKRRSMGSPLLNFSLRVTF